MHKACINGDLRVIKYLLSFEVFDLEERVYSGIFIKKYIYESILDIAVYHNNLELVEFLIFLGKFNITKKYKRVFIYMHLLRFSILVFL